MRRCNGLLQSGASAARPGTYNAVMKKGVRTLLLSCLLTTGLPAWGQGVPPGYDAPPREHSAMRELSPEQRQQFREERRQRREAWQQMSPEDRYQLRRDIREAGQTLYPRHRQRPD